MHTHQDYLNRRLLHENVGNKKLHTLPDLDYGEAVGKELLEKASIYSKIFFVNYY